MTVLITKCYSIVTSESAENGDIEDSGTVFEDSPMTFKELCREMANFPQTSESPTSSQSWTSTGCYIDDYKTGREREDTLHFSRKNPEWKRKYWEKAMRVNGLLKPKKPPPKWPSPGPCST